METTKYSVLSKLSGNQFRRYTDVIRYTFDIMAIIIAEYDWAALRRKTKLKEGRPCNLCLEDQILMLLEYYRENRTFFHLGTSYGLSESNAYRTIIKIKNII